MTKFVDISFIPHDLAPHEFAAINRQVRDRLGFNYTSYHTLSALGQRIALDYGSIHGRTVNGGVFYSPESDRRSAERAKAEGRNPTSLDQAAMSGLGPFSAQSEWIAFERALALVCYRFQTVWAAPWDDVLRVEQSGRRLFGNKFMLVALKDDVSGEQLSVKIELNRMAHADLMGIANAAGV